MLPFSTLVKIDKLSDTPVYQQIANKLVNLIQQGTISPGDALPGSREMAGLLKVHRKTVVAAYNELLAQDWIEAIPRKHVTVSHKLPELKPRSFKAASKIPAYAGNTGFSFEKTVFAPTSVAQDREPRLVINDGFPDPRIAPIDTLLKEYRSLFLGSGARKLMYSDMRGSTNLRRILTEFLAGTRGLNISTNNIMITHGAQMAIFLAARLILKPGSTVMVGEPNYFLADMIFQQFGAKLHRVPVDENGMDINFVELLCKRNKPDLLYIIPHHHHPTTVTLSAERRMQLLELIRYYKLPVIEDDYDYDFHYSSSPILPLASADHGGNVIYIGSLAKTFASSLRVGYMIAPENFIREAASFRRMIDIRSDNLMEEALALLFKNGDLQRHLKKSVKLYKARRDIFCDLLKAELNNAVMFQKPSGGLALWVKFQEQYALPSIAARASAKGLFMSDGSNYSCGTTNYNALRMGFASLNEKEMKEAVEIIKDCVGH